MRRMFNEALCKSKWTMLLLLLGVAFLASPLVDRAYASPVTFSFTGVISSITDRFGTPVIFGTSQFHAGDTVSASFTFDPAASPTVFFANEAVYDAVISSYNATTSGGYSASATTGQITMWNNSGAPYDDRFRAGMFQEPSFTPPYTLTGAAVDGLPLLDFVVAVEDPSQTAFSGTGLPSTLDLSKFDLNATYSGMQFVFGTLNQPDTYRLVNAHITGMSVVPVPATLLLLGPGLVGLAAIRRRFKK